MLETDAKQPTPELTSLERDIKVCKEYRNQCYALIEFEANGVNPTQAKKRITHFSRNWTTGVSSSIPPCLRITAGGRPELEILGEFDAAFSFAMQEEHYPIAKVHLQLFHQFVYWLVHKVTTRRSSYMTPQYLELLKEYENERK